jgi:hypothetical protein
MRARTVFIILFVLILLLAFGPVLPAVVSQEIAEAFGCQVDLNRVIPCVINGGDYGETFYNLGFAIWVFLPVDPGWRRAAGRLGRRRPHRFHREQAQADAGAGLKPMSKQNLGFLVGAIAIVLVAGAPVISVYTASAIASGLGCTLNEGDAHPCLFHGVDLGETLYSMVVVGWFGLATLPIGAIALAILLLVWIIVAVQDWRRRVNTGRDRL